MNRYFFIAFFVLLFGYGLVEAHPLLAGPTLSIASPKDFATSTDGVFTISGTEARAASLTLDGAPLLADENGFFSEELAFPSGTSILTFVATDRFGRTITKTRTIYVPN